MMPAMDEQPIPWPAALRSLLEHGYRCRRCRVAAVAENARHVVRLNPRRGDGPENLAVLCPRCHEAHAAGK